MIYKLGQPIRVSMKIINWSRRYTATHSSSGHRRSDPDYESWVKRLRDKKLRTKLHFKIFVRHGNDIRLFFSREFGNRSDSCQLHSIINLRRTNVKSTPKNKRKAQYIVNLIGKIRSPRRHNSVRSCLFNNIWMNFRIWVS